MNDPLLLDEKASQYLKKSLNLDIGPLTSDKQKSRKSLKYFTIADGFDTLSKAPSRSETLVMTKKNFDANLYIKRMLYCIRNRKWNAENVKSDNKL